MRSVQTQAVAETTVSRSRFLAFVAPVRTSAEAASFLARVKSEHPDATHHSHAWVLGPDGSVHRSSDDGEPGGTAGTPMLEVLRKAGFTNVVAVVVRWFGGVKLGAGGLARAYAGAVRAALAVAVPAFPVVREDYEVTFPASVAGATLHALRETADVQSESYGDDVIVRCRVRADGAAAMSERIARSSSGSAVAVLVASTVTFE